MQKLWFIIILTASTVFLSGCQQILERHSKSGLQVITDDVPSAVYLNGQYLNSTPLIEKELKPGEYTLRIEPNDSTLQPYETSVMLRKGLLSVVTWKPAELPEMSGGVIYEMEQLKNSSAAEVSFVTIPDAAIVTLDGKAKEFSPIVFNDVAPGNKSFEVTLPSYETQNHTINVQPGYRMLVRIKLAKLQAVGEVEKAEITSTAAPQASTSAQQTASASAKPSPTSTNTLLSTSSATLNQ